MPSSTQKEAISKVLLNEGYILGFHAADTGSNKRELVIELKYFDGRPVIDEIRRVSKSGLRIYRGKEALPKIQGGLGIAIVSTPIVHVFGTDPQKLNTWIAFFPFVWLPAGPVVFALAGHLIVAKRIKNWLPDR